MQSAIDSHRIETRSEFSFDRSFRAGSILSSPSNNSPTRRQMKGKSVRIHQQLTNLGFDLSAKESEANVSPFINNQVPVSNLYLLIVRVQGMSKLELIKENSKSKIEKKEDLKFSESPDTFYTNLFSDKIQSKQYHGMMEIKFEKKAYFPGETVNAAVCF